MVGTKQHGRGTVDAQIIKADIPVQVEIFAHEQIRIKEYLKHLQNGVVYKVKYFQN